MDEKLIHEFLEKNKEKEEQSRTKDLEIETINTEEENSEIQL